MTLTPYRALDKKAVEEALNEMILSPSGWRGVFSANGEEDSGTEISPRLGIIAAAGAFVFAEYIQKISPVVILGMDTRPTGPALAKLMIRAFIASGCRVFFAGVSAAPEIMAYSKTLSLSSPPGYFAYISASHNPIGHNGIKFGLDGGVLAGPEAIKLIASLKDRLAAEDAVTRVVAALETADDGETARVYRESAAVKREALAAYRDFSALVIAGPEAAVDDAGGAAADNAAVGGTAVGGAATENGADSGRIDEKPRESPGIFAAIKAGLAKRPLGIAADFNGSARTLSIDEDLFRSLGIGFRSITGKPGEIAHAIIPEGESLVPCARFLTELHASDPSFTLGYVPDCDGDRGNLVIWDEAAGAARILEAQEVFALACAAELSHLVWTGALRYDQNGRALVKAAVALNGPTSMRIDRIAEAFGVEVFRAEVGEANVVNLARLLREQGYLVRILGEGSNGGNITHPSAVRDPLATLFALIKLLAIRGPARGGPESCSGSRRDPETGGGFFHIWLERAGLESRAVHNGRDDGKNNNSSADNFTLSDIIASLPRFYTTGVSTPEAKLQVITTDHGLLKEKYQKVFLAEWEEKKAGLGRRGIRGFEARACIGSEEKRNLENFGDAETGGLKIVFTGPDKKDKAFIWMRGSKTESVFRVMADAEDAELERELIAWQRGMVGSADSM
ncbi:MAG: phosphatidylglycerol lysyltransferase [Treponema sp.]|jgi:phosphoglucomutase|nr:phosphatidylglycerol lysyltransferase [Treponema sp.]